MSKPVLYICHTPYQVLVSVAKVLVQPHPAHLCLAQSMPGCAGLAARLRASGLFEELLLPRDSEWPSPVFRGWRGLFLHRLQKAGIERQGFALHPEAYAEICIYNDWSNLGRYLQDLGAAYTLGEDTYDYLRKYNYLIDDQAHEAGYASRRKHGRGYLYWGAYRGTAVVEVASKESAIYWPQRQRAFDLFAALRGFGPAQMDVIRRVFIEQELPPMQPPTCLFLPRSYYIDGMLPSQAAQDALCRDLVAQYAEGYQLYIKTHPRDTTDYTQLFPQAVVLDRFMPSELLDYCFSVRFDRAVGLGTHSIRNLKCADEIIDLPESGMAPYQTL